MGRMGDNQAGRRRLTMCEADSLNARTKLALFAKQRLSPTGQAHTHMSIQTTFVVRRVPTIRSTDYDSRDTRKHARRVFVEPPAITPRLSRSAYKDGSDYISAVLALPER